MRLPVLAVTLGLLLSVSTSAFAKAGADYKASILIDCNTGAILRQENAHQHRDPASLIKMMVVLIAMERIKHGQLHLGDQITVTERAQHIGGHRVHLMKGEVFTAEELLKAVMIGSANDAAFLMAETMGGTQDEFVKLMNERARQLGMKDTHFANAHGLPPDRRKHQQANYSSAYDLTLVARELMKYPLVMKWTSTREDTFRNGTFRLINTNHKFLEHFPGADGLKTGFHAHGAGFNVVATAVRDGRRLLSVVLGADSQKDRLQVATRLLEAGFATKVHKTASSVN